MIKNVISCDVCGVDRKEVNHWFEIWVDEKGKFGCKPLPINPGVNSKQVCGSDHAAVLFHRFLSHGTLNPESTKAVPVEVPTMTSNMCKCGHLYTYHNGGKQCLMDTGGVDCPCLEFRQEEF